MLSLQELSRAAEILNRDWRDHRVERWVQDGDLLAASLYGHPSPEAGAAVKRVLAISGRAGLPVKTMREESFGAKRTKGKLAAIFVTRGASRRFTRPSTAFCSTSAAGMRVSNAAIITGRLG